MVYERIQKPSAGSPQQQSASAPVQERGFQVSKKRVEASDILPDKLKFSQKFPFIKEGSEQGTQQVAAAQETVTNYETQQTFTVNSERITQFQLERPGYAHLVAGINNQMNERQTISKLVENFYERKDFDYNFSYKTQFTGQGDCQTLVNEFIDIAQTCFNINMTKQSDDQGYFVPEKKKIIHQEDKTGNVDNGSFWYFETHTWAVWNGEPIDVLFGQYGIVFHKKVQSSGIIDGKLIYSADDVFYLKDTTSMFDRYTINPEQARSIDLPPAW